jgi:hypothetical protein
MKKIITYFLLLVLAMGACKKDQIQQSNVTVTTGNQTPSKANNEAIPSSRINSWFATHKVGGFLSPDWTKAEQKTINGAKVVKVPIKSISKLIEKNGNVHVNSTSLLAMDTLHFFNEDHPPMLFFISDENSGHPDSLKAVLMNFIPDDPNKENGENNVWTGRLVEWNMEDTKVPVQILNKSYVKANGVIDMNDLSSIPNKIKGPAITAIKTNNFFADLWDAVKTFVEAIGYFFGVPGDYNYYAPGVTLGWCDFLWGAFCGSSDTSGGGGGGGGYSSSAGYWTSGGPAYNTVYSGYVNGYNGTSGGGWDPYTGTGGNPPCPTPPVNVASIVNGRKVFLVQGCPVNPPPQPPPAPTQPAIPDDLNFPVFVNNEFDNNLPDENFDVVFNDTRYQNLPRQTKPTYARMNQYYPKNSVGGDMEASAVVNMVGGSVKALYDSHGYRNACALRVSVALNKCGIIIPNIPDHTFQGADGKYYFVSSTKLLAFLLRTFPAPDVDVDDRVKGKDGQGFYLACAGKKGIFIMVAKNKSLYGAYGHASLYDGLYCVGGPDHTPFNMDIYGGVSRIVLWKLP